MCPTLADLGESAFLERLIRRLSEKSHGVIVPAGDDAAVVKWASGNGIITTDTLVEETHFRLHWSAPEDLAVKLLHMNLSDVAAMGGISDYAVLALTAPGTTHLEWLDRFYDALVGASEAADVKILGGDTTEGTSLVLTLTVIGHVPDTITTISTAQQGDAIFVTGALGAAQAGLEVLLRTGNTNFNDSERVCVRKHLAPQSRWKDGSVIAQRLHPTAMTDISDGLFRDLRKICQSSTVGFQVTTTQIPVSPAAYPVAVSLGLDPIRLALNSGEEFELLFTTPQDKISEVEQLARELEVPMTRIGTILDAADGSRWRDSSGRELKVDEGGFEHFRQEPEPQH